MAKLSQYPTVTTTVLTSVIPVLESNSPTPNKYIPVGVLADMLKENTGFTGSKGALGYTGSLGLGFTGSRGAVGYAGSVVGPDGFSGSRGFVGSRGQGFTGSVGVGFTGSSGPIGYTGSVGTGFTGSIGTGFTGSRGPVDYTGSVGELGYTGSLGPLGYTGSTGGSGGDSDWFTLNSYLNGGTTASISASVSGYSDLLIWGGSVQTSISNNEIYLQFSTNGGVNWFGTVGDYQNIGLGRSITSTVGVPVNSSNDVNRDWFYVQLDGINNSSTYKIALASENYFRFIATSATITDVRLVSASSTGTIGTGTIVSGSITIFAR